MILSRSLPSPAVRRPLTAPHMRAGERQRELAGQELVIGEPRPGGRVGQDIGRERRGGAGGAMRRKSPGISRAPGTPGPAIRATPAGLERAVDRLVQLAGEQAFGERIDRLDQRQLGEPGFVDHPVGMHHLQHAVVERGGARDVAALALRQQLCDVVRVVAEIGEHDVAGVVARIDQIGRAPAGRRRPVAVDGDRHGRDRAGHHVAQFWPGAAVDRAGRQVKDQIGDARAVLAAGEAAQGACRPSARPPAGS